MPEYFVFGHDTPESMYEFGDKLLHSDRKKISFLFAGIGDARNLHRTLLSIAMQDNWKPEIKERSKCFHFTVNDHKPAVIARDIVILLMLDDMSKAPESPEEEGGMVAIDFLPLLYYTYLAPIMPKLFYDLLQVYIQHAVDALEVELKRSLPSFLDVPQTCRSNILRVLREWQSEVQEEYSTRRVRLEAVRTRNRSRMQQTLRNGAPGLKAPYDCQKQEEFYLKTGVLFLDSSLEPLLGEELNAAYDAFDKLHPQTPSTAVLEHVDLTWRTNVTFVDLEWQRNREGWDGSPQTAASHMDLDVAHNPFELAIRLSEDESIAADGKGLCYRTSNWFHSVARAMKQLHGRYIVEACVGDVNELMEQIRYGIVGHRKGLNGEPNVEPAAGAPNGAETRELLLYPTRYDRIHLSNIPDYVGGTLSVFMYGLPILHPGETSYITSCCLRNPPRFRTPRHFNNEYIGLSAESDLEKSFHVRMEPLPFPGDAPLVMTEYLRWSRTKTSTDLVALMSRPDLELRLHRLFFKLAIPKERQARDFLLIWSPLNLTAFVRVCIHLHGIGYPAHWISDVVSDILSGKLTSKSRPPRSEPLKIREVKEESSNKTIEQSTAPFVAELSTLVSLWQQAGTLRFGILSCTVPDVTLVHKYSVTFDDVPDIVAETPSFVLLLFDTDLLPPQSTTIRPYLLDDERGDRSPRARAIRERGLHVLSTWGWHRPSKTATFWLRKDVFERLEDKKWAISIWRTDNWISQSPPQRMIHVCDLGICIEEGM